MEELVKEKVEDDGLFIVDDEEENTQANKYLLFNIGEEAYGISIANVTEIIEMQKITEVPDMLDFVKGVINLRGRVIPVVDLRMRFGLEERAYDDRTCVIVVNVVGSSLAFIVDRVAEVQNIQDSDIEPPPNFKKDETRGQYICGMGKVGDEVKILIDVESIFQEKELKTIKDKTKDQGGK